jgi:hypothetical protein
MKKTILFILMCLLGFTINAQSKCDYSLYEANKMYDKGLIYDAVQLLEPCFIQDNLAASEKFDAARLLALCYLYLDNNDSAEFYVKKMLKLKPDYQKYPNIDPHGLTVILNKYEVVKSLELGLSTGLSLNQVQVIKNYSTANTPSTYNSKIGLRGGLLLEYHMRNKFSLLMNPSVSTMSYERSLENVSGSKKDYSELISSFSIPIFIRKYQPIGKWNLHYEAGIEWNWIMRSFADVQSTNLLDKSVIQSSTETTSYRNRGLMAARLGVGASKPFGKGTLSVTFNYVDFLTNFVDPDRRYDNSDFIISSQYIDSDFRISSFGMFVSYQVPITYSVIMK